MEIQVLSDCHLECYTGFPRIRALAKYLILAGDIGVVNKRGFNSFIDYVSRNWEKVIFVMGNHEFYSNQTHYEATLATYRAFFNDFDNVFLLEKEETYLDNYRVLGTTMWSHLSHDTQVSSPKKVKKLILNKNKRSLEKMGIEGINRLHEDSINWLINTYDPHIPTIIVTHYPLTTNPYYIRQVKHRNESFDKVYDFSSDLPVEPKNELICISGHTHYGHDFKEGKYIRYISNQQGYPDESKQKLTNRSKTGLYYVGNLSINENSCDNYDNDDNDDKC